MKRLILILGGEKSGKSEFALKEGERFGVRRAFLATAEGFDDELRERIERHRIARGKDWVTIEEPLRVSEVISNIEMDFDVIVLDCLTIWLGNLFHHGLDVNGETFRLLDVISKRKTNIVIVSNEVGLGIVPENDMARRFTTALGNLNKEVAKISDKVIFMVSGIPITIKNQRIRR